MKFMKLEKLGTLEILGFLGQSLNYHVTQDFSLPGLQKITKVIKSKFQENYFTKN